MTCLVAISLPALALVAADTRLNLLEAGEFIRMDARLGAYELNSGRSLPIPDGCRKIRKIGSTWLAASGDAVTGELGFSTFNTWGFQEDQLVQEWERIRTDLRVISHSETGFPYEEIDRTRFLIALRGQSPKVVSLTIQSAATIDSSNFMISWPPGIAGVDSEEARHVFRNELQTALDTVNVFGVVRAAIRAIKTASEKCVTVGPFVHVGFSIGSPEEPMHLRVQGDSGELLLLNDAGLQERFIRAD